MITIKDDYLGIILSKLEHDSNFREELENKIKRTYTNNSIYYNILTDDIVTSPMLGATINLFDVDFDDFDKGLDSYIDKYKENMIVYNKSIIGDSEPYSMDLVQYGNLSINYLNKKEFYNLIAFSRESISESVIKYGILLNKCIDDDLGIILRRIEFRPSFKNRQENIILFLKSLDEENLINCLISFFEKEDFKDLYDIVTNDYLSSIIKSNKTLLSLVLDRYKSQFSISYSLYNLNDYIEVFNQIYLDYLSEETLVIDDQVNSEYYTLNILSNLSDFKKVLIESDDENIFQFQSKGNFDFEDLNFNNIKIKESLKSELLEYLDLYNRLIGKNLTDSENNTIEQRIKYLTMITNNC